MLGLLKKLFGGGGSGGGDGETHQGDPVEYEGYTVTPCPMKEPQGWRVSGTVTREVDGELKTHRFIRADVYFNLDDTLATTLAKGKRLVDEQGDRLFAQSP